MLRRALTLAVAAAAGTWACENVTETSYNQDLATIELSKGRVVQSVSGSGHLRGGPGFSNFRSFSFSALRYADETVKGQWQAFGRGSDPPIVAHGRVICFTIVDNSAWVAGVVEKSSAPGEVPPGQERVWQVTDNGQGAGASPDQISTTYGFPADVYCDQAPLGAEMHDVQYGNIQIKG